MMTAWGDESVRKSNVPEPMYLMGACICDLDEKVTRSCLDSIKPKNADKLHWRDMQSKLRSQAIEAISGLGLTHIIVAAVPLNKWNTAERARRKCLEKLLPILENEYSVDMLVLEQRDKAQDDKDIRFIDALRSRKFISTIRVKHIAGRADARLWLPDQLLGSYGDSQAGECQYDNFLFSVRKINADND